MGDKAYEHLGKDPLDVFFRFKVKMGTNESFRVSSLGKLVTPQDLSSYVLRELLTFVQAGGGESVDSTVVTVPASFDPMQSNATLEAGKLAGFKQVILLQEPIAASLALVNQRRKGELPNGKWLVYDLGGGTFDLALVSVTDGELRVIDHEGDNNLGGGNFDDLIIREIVVPYLESNYKLEGLKDLRNASSKHNALYYRLLFEAEKAKVELSARTAAEIEVTFTDDAGSTQDAFVPVTRSQFDRLILPLVDRTVEMVKTLFTRNNLMPTDVQFLLMVGGSTYIPVVRERVGELSGVRVNCDVDPVTAIAVGAAYYAGTRRKEVAATPATQQQKGLHVRTAFNRVSREVVEPIAIAVDGDTTGLYYRITSEDGSFDSGLKRLQPKVFEELRLVSKADNLFSLRVYDEQGRVVPSDAEPIQILQGIYAISGQPLPADISLGMVYKYCNLHGFWKADF